MGLFKLLLTRYETSDYWRSKIRRDTENAEKRRSERILSELRKKSPDEIQSQIPF